jgi:hypothetical protein
VVAGATAAVSLFAVEAFLRLDEERRGRDELRIFDPRQDPSDGDVLDVKQNFRQMWRAPEFTVAIRTGGAGFREDREVDLGDVDVAFFGDSFVFGHGVEQDERLSDAVARRLSDEVVVSLAYGNGFAPSHYRIYAERHPELRPRLAVVGLYLGNDLDADMRETRVVADPGTGLRRVVLPFRSITPQGHLMHHPAVLRPAARVARDCCALGRFLVGLLNRSERRAMLFEGRLRDRPPNSPNPRELDLGTLLPTALEALEDVVGLRDLVATRGGRTVVLLIPQNFYVARNARPHGRLTAIEVQRLRRKRPLQRRILAWCARRDLDCLDATPGLAAHPRAEELYFREDAHWTARGHAAAAAILLDHLGLRAGPTGEPGDDEDVMPATSWQPKSPPVAFASGR